MYCVNTVTLCVDVDACLTKDFLCGVAFKCLTSSLLKHKLVNALFAVQYGCKYETTPSM